MAGIDVYNRDDKQVRHSPRCLCEPCLRDRRADAVMKDFYRVLSGGAPQAGELGEAMAEARAHAPGAGEDRT